MYDDMHRLRNLQKVLLKYYEDLQHKEIRYYTDKDRGVLVIETFEAKYYIHPKQTAVQYKANNEVDLIYKRKSWKGILSTVEEVFITYKYKGSKRGVEYHRFIGLLLAEGFDLRRNK